MLAFGILAAVLTAKSALAGVPIATFDSAQGTTWPWEPVNDTVMGGQSESTFQVDSSTNLGVWKGEVKVVPFLQKPGFSILQAPGRHKKENFPDLTGTNGLVARMKVEDGGLTNFKMMLMTKGNKHERVGGVGAYGGWCKCPDGRRYQVGDNGDSCASLACINGVPGDCERIGRENRSGMRATCARQVQSRLVMSGTCNGNDGVYEYGGLTASTAPWFKKVGGSIWIYHDPDCDGTGTFSQRWVLARHPPSSTAVKDLDGDRDCKGVGYYKSTNFIGGPPTSATWNLECNSLWKATRVSIEAQAGGTPEGKEGVYEADITLTSKMEDHFRPWSAFSCTWRGQPVSWCPELTTQLAQVGSVGFGTAGSVGKFDVKIEALSAPGN